MCDEILIRRIGAVRRIVALLSILGLALMGLVWLGDAGAWLGSAVGIAVAVVALGGQRAGERCVR